MQGEISGGVDRENWNRGRRSRRIRLLVGDAFGLRDRSGSKIGRTFERSPWIECIVHCFAKDGTR